MASGTVRLGVREPRPPADADFAIYIGFKKGDGDPLRVFRAADQAIKALQLLDKAFCESIDSTIEPMMVLEDIEAGSLKIWLRNLLTAADDHAIKNLDWKPAVGKYLVRAKYVLLEWTNQPNGESSLPNLLNGIRAIAQETEVRHLPDYAPPNMRTLIEATTELNSAKGALIPGDSMRYLSHLTEPVDFDLAARVDIAALEELSIKEKTKLDNMQMNLVVKKPDYLGVSMWEFRHGTKTIQAKIHDGEWLANFQNRRVDIRPGDALKCLVTVEFSYGFDNELVRETYVVEKVMAVLVNQGWTQHPLLPDHNS